MICEKTVDITKALVVDPLRLRALIVALPEQGNKYKYEVRCSDGSRLTSSSLEEILNLPNPRSRSIVSLKINSPYSETPHVRITFDLSEYLPSSSYSIDGEDSTVVFFSNQIDQHLETMVGDFPSLSAMGWSALGISSVAIGIVMCTAAGTIIPMRVQGAKFGITLLLLSAVVILFGIFCLCAPKYVFPQMTFCIGDGESRHRRLVARRAKFNIGAILIAILASLIAASIFKYF